MGLSTGDIIDGKYRIVRLLGEGGMGAVYEGENTRIHRKVAIKVLHSAVAENSDAVQRFEREAQAAGRIGSQHIVEVLDLGDLPDGDRYMVMEFMDGTDLSGHIQAQGKITPANLFPIADQLLEGLAAAHDAGIIHRDLKPDNVYLLENHGGQRNFVKILDFGISKFNALSGESGFSMTRTGAVMGTPYYMSPEQAKGAKGMDQRADLYSVGVILYECVTGQVPFNADTFNELLFKIVLEEPPPLSELVPDIDPAFASLIERGMAREPASRFQTAREFQQAIREWAQTGAGVVVAGSGPHHSIPDGVANGGRGSMASISGAAAAPAAAAAGAAATAGGAGAGLGGTQAAWSNADDSKGGKGKTGLMIGIAALVLLLGGVGIAAVAMSGGGSAAAATPTTTPSAAATDIPTAEPSSTPGPDPTIEATAEPMPPASAAPSAAPEASAEPTPTAKTPVATPPRRTPRPTTPKKKKPEVKQPSGCRGKIIDGRCVSTL